MNSKWMVIYKKLQMNDPELKNILNAQDFADIPDSWFEGLNIENVPSISERKVFETMYQGKESEGAMLNLLKEFGLDKDDLDLDDKHIRLLKEQCNALDSTAYDDYIQKLRNDHKIVKSAIKELQGYVFLEDEAVFRSKQLSRDIGAAFGSVLELCKDVTGNVAASLNANNLVFVEDYTSAVNDFVKLVEKHSITLLNEAAGNLQEEVSNDIDLACTGASVESTSSPCNATCGMEDIGVLESKLRILLYNCTLMGAQDAGLKAALELFKDAPNIKELLCRDSQGIEEGPAVKARTIQDLLLKRVEDDVQMEVLGMYSLLEIHERVCQTTSLMERWKKLIDMLIKQRNLYYVMLLLLAFQIKLFETSSIALEDAWTFLEKKAKNAELRIASLESAKERITKLHDSTQGIFDTTLHENEVSSVTLPVTEETSLASKVVIPAELKLDEDIKELNKLIKQREESIEKMTEMYGAMVEEAPSLTSFTLYLGAFNSVKSASESLHHHFAQVKHQVTHHEELRKYQLLWIDFVLHRENFEELRAKLEQELNMLPSPPLDVFSPPLFMSTPISDRHTEN